MKDDFIGQTFPTPNGGRLTVVGVVGKSKNGIKIYSSTCSICSLDKELFPDLFESQKGNLVNGNVPCGCSKFPKWRPFQVEIIARRLCVEMDYEFLGFPDGYKNSKSKFEYNCPVHGKQKVSYDSFVNQGSRCPECGIDSQKDKLRNPEAETITKELCDVEGYEFLGFHDGYKNAFSKFSYNCPVHGKQTASYNDFVNGGSRCPSCGGTKKKTLEEAETIVKELCVEMDYQFLGFPDGYKNQRSKFSYICPTHGKQSVSYTNFVNIGNRCPSCANYGYDQSKPGYFYLFRYELSSQIPVYKFGITNRLTKIRSNEHIAGIKDVKSKMIYEWYFDDGSIPKNMEKYIKDNYETGISNWLTSGNTETLAANDASFEVEAGNILMSQMM